MTMATATAATMTMAITTDSARNGSFDVMLSRGAVLAAPPFLLAWGKQGSLETRGKAI